MKNNSVINFRYILVNSPPPPPSPDTMESSSLCTVRLGAEDGRFLATINVKSSSNRLGRAIVVV